jgi:hypothetical protein
MEAVSLEKKGRYFCKLHNVRSPRTARSKSFRIHPNASKSIQILPNPSKSPKSIQMLPNPFRSFQTHRNPSKSIQIRPYPSKLIQIPSNPSCISAFADAIYLHTWTFRLNGSHQTLQSLTGRTTCGQIVAN